MTDVMEISNRNHAAIESVNQHIRLFKISCIILPSG